MNGKIEAKVIICGVARDCADRLPYSIAVIENIASMFEESKIILHENDSSDDTRFILIDFVRRCPDVYFTFRLNSESNETWINYQAGKPYRPEQISRARNIVLRRAMDADLDNFSHVMMIDLDFVIEPDYEGIAESFQRSDWDAVFANGIDPSGRFWDWFALRDENYPLGVESLGDGWWHLYRPAHFLRDEWHPVYSAFGGCGIYRRQALLGCQYSALLTPEVKMLNDRFGSGPPWQTHQGIGPDPSLCEHVGLHAAMIARGSDRLFINPRMVFRYSGGPELALTINKNNV